MEYIRHIRNVHHMIINYLRKPYGIQYYDGLQSPDHTNILKYIFLFFVFYLESTLNKKRSAVRRPIHIIIVFC